MKTSSIDLAAENQLLREQLDALKATHAEALQQLNERIVIEEQLKESQQRFRTVFEQSQVAHKIINTDLIPFALLTAGRRWAIPSWRTSREESSLSGIKISLSARLATNNQ